MRRLGVRSAGVAANGPSRSVAEPTRAPAAASASGLAGTNVAVVLCGVGGVGGGCAVPGSALSEARWRVGLREAGQPVYVTQ
jgi:hypothetical protein